MAGVGKTALALRAAHLLADRFDGGALQRNLRGHDLQRQPVTSEDALILLLGDLGANTRDIQSTGIEGARVAWRRHTAGKRILLFLDDATDVEQITPLLPAGIGSVVIVTSRRILVEAPQAFTWNLQPLPPSDARALMVTATNRAELDDGAALEIILRTCGGLPLALWIAGSLLRNHPSWSLDDLAAHIEQHRPRKGEQDAVLRRLAPAFDTTYRELPDEARRILRRLALHPGAEFSFDAIASMTDAGLQRIDHALDTLVEHHVVSEVRRHQYRLHDALRAYAFARGNEDDTALERHDAVGRLINFYLTALDHGAAIYQPYRHVNLAANQATSRSAPVFVNQRQAETWLEEEHDTLLAVTRRAHTDGWQRESAALAHMLVRFLDHHGDWKNAMLISEDALFSWTQLDYQPGQAYALTDLTTAYWRLERLDEAIMHGQAALDLWCRLGDRGGQADLLTRLGRVHIHTRQLREAIDCYQQALELYADLRDQRGTAVAGYHLACALVDIGRYDEAITHHERALTIARNIRDDAVIRNCLNNLGEVHRHRGDHQKALTYYQEALKIARRLSYPHEIAIATLNLGATHDELGDAPTAIELINSAIERLQELGDSRIEAEALIAQARSSRHLDRVRHALSALERAATLAEQLHDPLLQTRVHIGFGDLYLAQRSYPLARDAYRRALVYASRAVSVVDEAHAHYHLGTVLNLMGSHAARSHLKHAAALFDQMGMREAKQIRTRMGIVQGA
jgi:tetratricopeptide (TPR) repeat protein